jgi:stage II sporulation protein AA (anti-sigma F factor antagonist)
MAMHSSDSSASSGADALYMWQLTITREDRDDVAVLVASGRLGTRSSAGLIDTLTAAIDGDRRRVVLDLAGVDYLSSPGLAALHAFRDRLAAAGGTLVLCGLTPPVRVAFELSGLLPDFAEEPSRDLAVARAMGHTASA